jgi:hypothetical protein
MNIRYLNYNNRIDTHHIKDKHTKNHVGDECDNRNYV